jgi:hypothetical protein
MAESQVDPARLHGEELRRWYMRSPAEIEEERQAAAQRRYDSYFGGTRAGAPEEDLTELRRQQAEFAKVRRQADIENSWLAAGALAPVAVVAGLEGAGALGLRALQSPWAMPKNPLSFLEREAWQLRALTRPEKTALREVGRARLAQANGSPARKMEAEVHHSDPLQFAHLKPKADPNRLSNLWPLRPEAHQIANREWEIFTRALKGRVPSQAEVMAAKLRIDKLVAPYIRRPGAPWSIKPPGGKGGPI